MKLKTGIIGCGKVGDFHAKAYAQLENSEFTAVCDANLERAKAFAERYNVHAYSDIAEMIQKEHLDVVSVCTPHPIHCDPAVTAAENGCNVLIEKPLASSLADCDRIIEAGDKNHVTIGTMVQRRFYRPCMRIHEAIEAGKIGKPVLGMVTMLGWRDKAYYDSDAWRGTWKGEGGGVLVNQAPHQLDLLLWYMGDVDEVYGVWKNLNHPYIEVEDTAVAVVKFKSGAVGNIVVSNSQNPALYGKVHVFGENGAGVGVQTDGGAMFIAGMSTITEPPYNDLWTVEARPTSWRTGRRATATSSTAWTPCTTTIRSRSRTFSTPWRPTLSPWWTPGTAARPWSCSRPSTAAPRPTPSSNFPSAEMSKKECCCL